MSCSLHTAIANLHQSDTSHRHLQHPTRFRRRQGNNTAKCPERLRYIIASSSPAFHRFWRHTSTAVHTAPSYYIIYEPTLRPPLQLRPPMPETHHSQFSPRH